MLATSPALMLSELDFQRSNEACLMPCRRGRISLVETAWCPLRKPPNGVRVSTELLHGWFPSSLDAINHFRRNVEDGEQLQGAALSNYFGHFSGDRMALLGGGFNSGSRRAVADPTWRCRIRAKTEALNGRLDRPRTFAHCAK
jgi:hypothetical protein